MWWVKIELKSLQLQSKILTTKLQVRIDIFSIKVSLKYRVEYSMPDQNQFDVYLEYGGRGEG